MRGINRVFLLGHLGHDPVVRHTPTGRAVCDLRLATNRSIKKGETWTDEVDWIPVRMWEQKAELALRFLKKGSPLAVEGQIREERWTDTQNNKRSRLFVYADTLHLLPGARRDGEQLEGPMEPGPQAQDDDASIPF